MPKKKTERHSTEEIPQMPFNDALRIALSTPPLHKEKKKRSKKARSKGIGLARG
jgi:hypothetical protein